MASGLDVERARINQALHGYREGHDLLAGSIDLDEESASSMLVMSDLAPRGITPPGGWITAYPLPRAGMYVIAHTWPAPEMPRPGCVWTHSVILDYATLGAASSLAPFLKLFRRPTGELHRYRESFDAPSWSPSERLPPRLYSVARKTLLGLYSDSKEVHRFVTSMEDAQRLAVAIWEQQWPRLRRRFRWTTLDAQPSTEVQKFDLCIVPKKRDELRDSAELSRESRQGWLLAALADLRAGGGDLRSELRRLAIDVQTGRRAFPLLVTTLILTGSPTRRPSDAAALIAQMSKRMKPDEAQFAKGAVVAALLSWSDSLHGESLNFALQLLPNLDEGPDSIAIARAIWTGARAAFWQRLPESPIGQYAQDRVLDEVDAKSLIAALADAAADCEKVLSKRPELVSMKETWQTPPFVKQSLTALVRGNPELIDGALVGAFATEDADLADDLIGRGDRTPMFDVYQDWERVKGRGDEQRGGFPRAWLAAASQDQRATRRYLTGKFRLRPSVVTLARICGVDSYPPEPNGEDVWVRSWEECAGRPVQTDREYISTFFLYRACFFRGRGRGGLFASSFSNLLEYFERGLSDPASRALVADLFSRY